MRKVKASGMFSLFVLKYPNTFYTRCQKRSAEYLMSGVSQYVLKLKVHFKTGFEINSCSFRESLYLLIKLHSVLLESLQLLQQVA